MEPIVIHTGLDHFCLLDRVTAVTDRSIQGELHGGRRDTYLLIEAMAQLGALHVRYLTDFSVHAFLVSMREADLPADLPGQGYVRLKADLEYRSSSGFVFTINAVGNLSKLGSGSFLFAVTPYDSRFEKEKIQAHYREMFACLQNGSRKS